jgi:hypothetical protein
VSQKIPVLPSVHFEPEAFFLQRTYKFVCIIFKDFTSDFPYNIPDFFSVHEMGDPECTLPQRRRGKGENLKAPTEPNQKSHSLSGAI